MIDDPGATDRTEEELDLERQQELEAEMDSGGGYDDYLLLELDQARCPTCGFVNGCNCDVHTVGPDE